MKFPTKARIIYALLTAIVVAAGLSTRALKRHHPDLGDAAGDALWATMAFMLISLVFPTAPLFKRAVGALVISFSVEFSQIYHAPWIDRIRAKKLGAMVLGTTFSFEDLLWYILGVGLGVILELLAIWRRPAKLQR